MNIKRLITHPRKYEFLHLRQNRIRVGPHRTSSITVSRLGICRSRWHAEHTRKSFQRILEAPPEHHLAKMQLALAMSSASIRILRFVSEAYFHS